MINDNNKQGNMKQKQQAKEYKTPQFQLVRQDESNKVFSTASSPSPTPTSTLTGGTLTNIGSWA